MIAQTGNARKLIRVTKAFSGTRKNSSKTRPKVSQQTNNA